MNSTGRIAARILCNACFAAVAMPRLGKRARNPVPSRASTALIRLLRFNARKARALGVLLRPCTKPDRSAQVIGKARLNSTEQMLIQPDLTDVRFSLILTYSDQENDYLVQAKVSLLTTFG